MKVLPGMRRPAGKNPDAATAATPATPPLLRQRSAPVTPRRVPWKVRLQLTWVRLKALFVHWYVNPAAPPEAIGKTKVSAKHRPVPIELGFYLHADGSVYHRMRTGDGDRKIESDDVKALVHREYRILRDTQYARLKQRQKIIERLRRFASRRKDLDTTKTEAVS